MRRHRNKKFCLRHVARTKNATKNSMFAVGPDSWHIIFTFMGISVEEFILHILSISKYFYELRNNVLAWPRRCNSLERFHESCVYKKEGVELPLHTIIVRDETPSALIMQYKNSLRVLQVVPGCVANSLTNVLNVTKLQSLSFSMNRHFKSSMMKVVCKIKTLTSLDMSGVSAMKDCMQDLGALSDSLLELNLSHTNIPESSFVHIRPLQNLHRLYMDGNPICTTMTCYYISQVTSLSSLSLSLGQHTISEVLWPLRKLSGCLRSLSVSVQCVGETQEIMLLGDIACLRWLTRLRFTSCSFSAENMKHIRPLVNSLKTLELVGPANISSLRYLYPFSRSLQELKLEYCLRLHDEGLQCLQWFTALQTLTLWKIDEMCDGPDLSALVNLRVLNIIFCTNFTGRCLSTVSARTTLYSLHVQGCVLVQDDAITAMSLESFTAMRELNVNHCTSLTDAIIPAMAACSQLDRISVFGTSIAPTALSFLAKNCSASVVQ